jgi:hypothetical protein
MHSGSNGGASLREFVKLISGPFWKAAKKHATTLPKIASSKTQAEKAGTPNPLAFMRYKKKKKLSGVVIYTPVSTFDSVCTSQPGQL